MARIELSNIGGGGTTLSLTTTGTSGAATLAGSVLNIPVYQGQLTLTTTGTSGAATLSGDILNIPQYSGGGTPAGSTGQIQYNNAGAFGASSNLAWVNTPNPQLNIGAPSAPTARLNVKGAGTLSSTVNLRLTDSGNTEIFRVADDGSILATNLSYDPVNRRLGVGGAATNATINLQPPPLINASVYFQNPDATTANFSGVGFIPQVTTNTTGFAATSGSIGSIAFVGFNSTTAGSFPAIFFGGHCSSTAPTGPAITFNGWKHNGTTGRTAMTGSETIASFGGGFNYIASFRANGTMNIGADFTPAATINIRGSNTSSGTNALLVQNNRSPTPDDIYKIENNGKISYLATNTAAGTTGPQTINRPSGTVNFGIGATSLVVTNSLCTTSSIVFATVRTNDATAQIKNVVPAAGSFTINLSAAATAETSVGFFIIN